MEKIPLSRRLGCIKHLIKIEIDRQIEQYNITMEQARLLTYLNRQEKELINQKEIGFQLELTKGSISTMLTLLENNGYIKRTVGDDARYRVIVLTDAAREVLDKVKKMINEIEGTIVLGFSDEELAHLDSYIERINNNIKNKYQRKEQK